MVCFFHGLKKTNQLQYRKLNYLKHQIYTILSTHVISPKHHHPHSPLN